MNETVYNYMKFANSMPNGCQDQVALCKATNRTSLSDYALCTEATNMCRDNVGMYQNCSPLFLIPCLTDPFSYRGPVLRLRQPWCLRHPSPVQ